MTAIRRQLHTTDECHYMESSVGSGNDTLTRVRLVSIDFKINERRSAGYLFVFSFLFLKKS